MEEEPKALRSASSSIKKRRRKRSNAPARMADVAIRAGVSTASVSRALNEPEKVSEKVRRKVYTAIDELGWVPSGAARILASHKTRTIGAIIPTLANVVFALVMNTIQKRLMEDGYTLIIGNSEYDQDQALLQVRNMIERGVDGLILIGEDFSEPFWDLLVQHRKPYVVMYNFRPESTRPCVGIDNYAVFARLTRHMLDLGHRRFGIIAQDGSNNDRAKSRLLGALATLRNHGVRVRPEHLVVKEWSIAQGCEGMREILSHPNPPTAILCVNDHLAIGAISECQARGLRIPQDISITGFDDLEFASYVQPSLTTVHVPREAQGLQTAEFLLGALEGVPTVQRKKLEAEVIIRQSTGPAPADGQGAALTKDLEELN